MLIDVFNQVEARGEKKGIEKGILKSKKTIAKELLKRNMPKEEVAKIVHLEIKELENV